MSNPYVGEIRLFAGNFAPAGWALCNGQLMAISENDALFTLIGTTYGGDGESTFGLPDLRGRIPLHAGQGPGIGQSYTLGELSGVEEVTLTAQQMPVHTHAVLASTDSATTTTPAGNVPAASPGLRPYLSIAPDVTLAFQSVGAAGGSQPHANLMPTGVVNYIIALLGVYPAPN
jgi:microcystin-dependent protein